MAPLLVQEHVGVQLVVSVAHVGLVDAIGAALPGAACPGAEGHDSDLPGVLAPVEEDPLPELAHGGAGEGEDQDLPGAQPFILQKVVQAPHKRVCFPGAGAGRDQYQCVGGLFDDGRLLGGEATVCPVHFHQYAFFHRYSNSV